MCYLQKFNQANRRITLAIDDTTLGHSITHMKDYTRKLKAIRLSITLEKQVPPGQSIDMLHPSKDAKQVPTREEELPLLENAYIIDAHYGHAELDSNTTHVYVIPVNIREIRGKVMELLKEPVAADPEELNHPLAIQLEQALFSKLQGTQIDRTVIKKALHIIKKYHGGVKRKSGEPFFTHPMAVALILMDYTQDEDALVAALLHDTVEDTSLSMAHIKAMFGETVAFLVGKATNLEDNMRRLSLADHENLHRLINYEDKRAALVKLSDRLHNMRTIMHHPSIAKQKYIAKETLTFFVPMAKHLGVTPMMQELEKLSLEALEQED